MVKIVSFFTAKTKKYERFKDVFDPYDDETNCEPLIHSMSDALADIYRELKSGLAEWSDETKKLYIVWNWKFGFEIHWGHHAVDAFRALYFLLFAHIEGKYENHIGMRHEL